MRPKKSSTHTSQLQTGLAELLSLSRLGRQVHPFLCIVAFQWRLCQLLQMVGQLLPTVGNASICQVCNGFCGGTEGWRQLAPSHGQNQGHTHKRGLSRPRWGQHGQSHSVLWFETNSVEAIGDVHLCQTHPTSSLRALSGDFLWSRSQEQSVKQKPFKCHERQRLVPSGARGDFFLPGRLTWGFEEPAQTCSPSSMPMRCVSR